MDELRKNSLEKQKPEVIVLLVVIEVRELLLLLLLHFGWFLDDAKCIVVTGVCVSVCLSVSVRGRMPTLLHGPDVTWESGRGCP